MVDAFNSHVTTPDTQEQHVTVCDYLGGVGCMTSCMPEHFSTQAYCDSNSLPRDVFSYNNPSVPVNTSLYNAMSSPDFRARASACDVGVCGPPCNDTSALNMYRDPHSPTAHLLADSVDAIARHQHKIGVIECPTSIFDPQCQHLLDEVYARSRSHEYETITNF